MTHIYTANVDKHPNSTRDFTINLTNWLANLNSGLGDTISDVVWSAPDFTVVGSPIHTTTKATIRLSGGIERTARYKVTATVTTTTSGEIQPFTLYIRVMS